MTAPTEARMTTLQEAARNAIKLLEELRGISYLKYEHTAIENSAKELRTALVQQGEQQPVCYGCGIPAGDVHMSTCKSGKWPSRVSNGDTAAPQAQQVEPTDDQLVKGVKAMRLFVTKNSVADFKLGYMAALAAAPQAQDPIAKLFGTLPVYDTPAPQPAQGGQHE